MASELFDPQNPQYLDKRCPGCGRPARIVEGYHQGEFEYYAQCIHCPLQMRGPTKEEAAEKWNANRDSEIADLYTRFAQIKTLLEMFESDNYREGAEALAKAISEAMSKDWPKARAALNLKKQLVEQIRSNLRDIDKEVEKYYRFVPKVPQKVKFNEPQVTYSRSFARYALSDELDRLIDSATKIKNDTLRGWYLALGYIPDYTEKQYQQGLSVVIEMTPLATRHSWDALAQEQQEELRKLCSI